jgi:hypothetical protein
MPRSLEDYTPAELLEHARTLERSNGLFNTLMNDPETRSETLALVKKKNPNMSIPELDVKAQVELAVAKEREEREKTDARLREMEMRERLNAQRDRVKSQYELTDADVLEVEKLMTDKDAPIPHYDAAVKVYQASRAQATPTSSQLQVKTFDMPSKDTWGRGVGDKMALDRAFKEEAYKAVNELRGGGKRAA